MQLVVVSSATGYAQAQRAADLHDNQKEPGANLYIAYDANPPEGVGKRISMEPNKGVGTGGSPNTP